MAIQRENRLILQKVEKNRRHMQKENASKCKPSKIEKKENERKTFARPAESTRQTYDTTIVDLM